MCPNKHVYVWCSCVIMSRIIEKYEQEYSIISLRVRISCIIVLVKIDVCVLRHL